MLQDEYGQEKYSEVSKGNLATEYFRELFTSTNLFDFESLLEVLVPVL